MRITEVRVFPVREARLRAFVSIVIDDAFVVSDIRIIDGPNGRFLSMPSVRRRDGTYRDIAHPVNAATRRHIEELVLARYADVVAAGEGAEPRDEAVAARGDAPAAAGAESSVREVPLRASMRRVG